MRYREEIVTDVADGDIKAVLEADVNIVSFVGTGSCNIRAIIYSNGGDEVLGVTETLNAATQLRYEYSVVGFRVGSTTGTGKIIVIGEWVR